MANDRRQVNSIYVKEFMSNFLFILQNEYPAGWPVIAAENTLERDYFLYFGKKLSPWMLHHSAKCWNDVIKALFDKAVVKVISRDGNQFWKCFQPRSKTEMYTIIKHGARYQYLKNHRTIGTSEFTEGPKPKLSQLTVPLVSPGNSVESKFPSSTSSSASPQSSPAIKMNATTLIPLLRPSLPKTYKVPTIFLIPTPPAAPAAPATSRAIEQAPPESPNSPVSSPTQAKLPSLMEGNFHKINANARPYRRFHSKSSSDDDDPRPPSPPPIKESQTFLKGFQQSAEDPRLQRLNNISTVTTLSLNIPQICASVSTTTNPVDTTIANLNQRDRVASPRDCNTIGNRDCQQEQNSRDYIRHRRSQEPSPPRIRKKRISPSPYYNPPYAKNPNRGYRGGRRGGRGRPYLHRRTAPWESPVYCHYHYQRGPDPGCHSCNNRFRYEYR